MLIIGNLVILNVFFFQQRNEEKIVTNSVPLSTPESFPMDGCGPACQRVLERKIENIADAVATIAALPQPSTSTTKATATKAPQPLENYVPLGTGSTTNNEWEDISGAEGYINTQSYPNISTVYFETSLRIPTKNGRVYARLYNVTDKHPVWNSEVSTDQDKSTFVGSSPITLDAGNKVYRVQMKTTLQYESILDFARVKIITK